jgi:hypothetical protein
MLTDRRRTGRPAIVTALCGVTATILSMPASAQDATTEALLRRVQVLERRIQELEAERRSGTATPAAQQGAAPAAPAGAAPAALQALLDRFGAFEQRLGDLESSAVLSEPETRVKRVDVWVDKNGNEYDHPAENAKKSVTYQRERVLRRQTINEKIEEALAGDSAKRVTIGVDATSATQVASQTGGADSDADGHAYQLASADLTFTANLAQNTLFFADVVGLSGSPPDSEIPSLTLLNSYTARLVRQNEINLREAWLKTELFDQRLALSLGRLDLTNTFDRNVAANDETTQFISDALVNNPTLGLSSNGSGSLRSTTPERINFKIGAQQSNPDATNLSDSIFSLAEVGYLARPFSLPEGNYRAWYRRDNGSRRQRTAFGVSLDQKITPEVTLFARYGSADADLGHDRFYSGGVQFQFSRAEPARCLGTRPCADGSGLRRARAPRGGVLQLPSGRAPAPLAAPSVRH